MLYFVNRKKIVTKSEDKEGLSINRGVTPIIGKNRRNICSPDGRSTGDMSSSKKRANSTVKGFTREASPLMQSRLVHGRVKELVSKYSFSKSEVSAYEKACLYLKLLSEFDKAQAISQIISASSL